ncbi:MAG: hypothetical protein ACRDAX_06385 [Propionibacteriaceae bacterium]
MSMDAIRGFIRILLCGLLCTACASRTVSTDSDGLLPTPTSTPPTVVSPLDIHRPVLSYMPTQQEYSQMHQIHGKLVAECLSTPEQKISFIGAGNIYDPILRENANSPIWGNISTISDARIYGYHEKSIAVGYGGFNPIPVVNNPDCDPNVSKLFPDGKEYTSLSAIEGLPNDGPRRASNDSRTKPIVDEWSLCMKNRGFNFSGPLDAIEKYIYDKSPSFAEINTAVADMECKQKTNFVARMLAWQLVYDEDYINKNRAALEKQRQDIKDFIVKYS